VRISSPLLAVAAGVLIVLAGCGSSGHGHAKIAPASDAEVSFVVDGTTTYGTFEVPAHRAGERVAAALLLPGSGPTDRDGNQAAHGITPDTLKLIADLLSRQGIATLRFDKYFTGKTGAGRYAPDPAAATVQGDLRQADAAYQFLSHRPQIDPAKLLVVGHSEGGMFALQIAGSAAPKPAGLALLEPQDLRILTLVEIQFDEQIQAWFAQGQLTAEQAHSSAAAVARDVSLFRNNEPTSAAGMAPAVVQLVTPLLLAPSGSAYLRSWDAIVPVDLAAKVHSGTRVLITDGSRDTNVPPSTIGPLEHALTAAQTNGPGLQRIAGIDHDMHLASQPDTEAVLAPAVTTAIQQWAQPFATAH
jgi:hypothetical protein